MSQKVFQTGKKPPTHMRKLFSQTGGGCLNCYAILRLSSGHALWKRVQK